MKKVSKALGVVLIMFASYTHASMTDMQCLTQELTGPDSNRAEYIAATLEASRVFNIPPAILVGIKFVESGRGLNPHVSNVNTNNTTDRGYYQVNAEVWLPELNRIGLAIDNDNLHNVRNNALIAGWVYARQLQRVGDRLEAVGYYHKGGGSDQRAHQIRLRYKNNFMGHLRRLTRLCGDERQVALLNKFQ